MPQGFIYILVNPSIPGSVKIGKTERSPEDRARELSAATGVPTPFLVAYDEFFPDCDSAERFIHELLENRGVRTASNREFFSIRVQDAIRVVMEAKENLDVQTTKASKGGTAASVDGVPPWRELLEQGYSHEYGLGDCLEDRSKAIALYKRAIQLGAFEGYILVADSLVEDSPKEAIEWLKRGCEAGAYPAWLELALIYAGLDFRYDRAIPIHQGNAVKAFRMFFKQLDFFEYEKYSQFAGYFDEDGNRIFFILKKYIDLVKRSRSESADTDIILAFLKHFDEFITCSVGSSESVVMRAELSALSTNLLGSSQTSVDKKSTKQSSTKSWWRPW